jgi:hypothetical protein
MRIVLRGALTLTLLTVGALLVKSDVASCADSDPQCSAWAAQGQCNANPKYMMQACMQSCGRCGHLYDRGNLRASQGAANGVGFQTLAGGLLVDTTFVPQQCEHRTAVGMDVTMVRRRLPLVRFVSDCTPPQDYTGWLCREPGRGCIQDFGTQFDSSLSPGRKPFGFPLGAGHVIEGWDRGMIGMCVGEKRKLVIPSAMGYGVKGTSGIPSGSNLVRAVGCACMHASVGVSGAFAILSPAPHFRPLLGWLTSRAHMAAALQLFDVTVRAMKQPTEPAGCSLSRTEFLACRRNGKP